MLSYPMGMNPRKYLQPARQAAAVVDNTPSACGAVRGVRRAACGLRKGSMHLAAVWPGEFGPANPDEKRSHGALKRKSNILEPQLVSRKFF